MIKKLLNIYDEDLYLSIQVHAKTHKSDANAFINKAMEEKAARDGVNMIKGGEKMPVSTLKEVDFDGTGITDVDFEEAPEVKDDLTF